MDWKTLPAYITGSVDEELLLRNEFDVEARRRPPLLGVRL